MRVSYYVLKSDGAEIARVCGNSRDVHPDGRVPGVAAVTAPAYTVTPYRYAKDKQCARPAPDGSGWKTRAARLAEGCGGRWAHRAGGYLLSAAGVARFERRGMGR